MHKTYCFVVAIVVFLFDACYFSSIRLKRYGDAHMTKTWLFHMYIRYTYESVYSSTGSRARLFASARLVSDVNELRTKIE